MIQATKNNQTSPLPNNDCPFFPNYCFSPTLFLPPTYKSAWYPITEMFLVSESTPAKPRRFPQTPNKPNLTTSPSSQFLWSSLHPSSVCRSLQGALLLLPCGSSWYSRCVPVVFNALGLYRWTFQINIYFLLPEGRFKKNDHLLSMAKIHKTKCIYQQNMVRKCFLPLPALKKKKKQNPHKRTINVISSALWKSLYIIIFPILDKQHLCHGPALPGRDLGFGKPKAYTIWG